MSVPLNTPSKISFTRNVRPSVLVTLCDLRFAITRPQNRGELAVAVNALVVHLDGDDAFELLENLLEAVRQRMEMTQMQRADFFAVVRAPSSTAS